MELILILYFDSSVTKESQRCTPGDGFKYYFHRIDKFIEVLGILYQDRYSELWLS